MVDMKNFNSWFDVMGDVHVDQITKRVSVDGHVMLKKRPLPNTQGERVLPFEFDLVSGDFSIDDMGLTSLQGSPREVGRFIAGFNPIRNLVGGPEKVMKSYNIRGCDKLESLEGLATQIPGTFACEWHENLPLLRSLVADTIHLEANTHGWDKLKKKRSVDEILNKYAGQGKSGALNCALELKKAGHGGNSRW